MYKKGINLNTVTVATLKTLPGIGDNLARSLALHRELKSEFVNPSEFSAIVPENVYSGIAKEYNIYAVSPTVWESRVTNEPDKLYNTGLTVYFLENSSLTISARGDIYIINIPLGVKVPQDILREAGAVAGFKRLMGWRPEIKALLLTGTPDMDGLNNFAGRYNTGELFCPTEDDILNTGSKQKFIANMIMAGRVKSFAEGASILEGDFKLRMFAPSKDSGGCAILCSYGETSLLLMFNMDEKAQEALINEPTAGGLKPNALAFYGEKPSPLFLRFCSSPEMIDRNRKKKLISDGNLIYAS